MKKRLFCCLLAGLTLSSLASCGIIDKIKGAISEVSNNEIVKDGKFANERKYKNEQTYTVETGTLKGSEEYLFSVDGSAVETYKLGDDVRYTDYNYEIDENLIKLTNKNTSEISYLYYLSEYDYVCDNSLVLTLNNKNISNASAKVIDYVFGSFLYQGTDVNEISSSSSAFNYVYALPIRENGGLGDRIYLNADQISGLSTENPGYCVCTITFEEKTYKAAIKVLPLND